MTEIALVLNPRSSVNNCTREPLQGEKSPVSRLVINDHYGHQEVIQAPESDVVALNFEKLSRKERRELNRRLILEVRNQDEFIKEWRTKRASSVQAEPLVQKVIDDARWLGLVISCSQAKLMISGQRMCLDGKWWTVFSGELKSAVPPADLRAKTLLGRIKKALHGGKVSLLFGES